jgi:hypothetical protein
MVPESFETFFLVTAGAGGALIGLLFVAISIGPQRTFDPLAIAGAQHQRLAEATLLTMANGFIVSCVALVPGVDVGWIVLVLGAAGIPITIHLVFFLARTHWHEGARHAPSLHLLRVVSLSLVATVLYVSESVLGLRLLFQPADAGTIRSLAFIIISLYALALVRAWTLLGDPQLGWSGWFNPLQGLEAAGTMNEPSEAPSSSAAARMASITWWWLTPATIGTAGRERRHPVARRKRG